MSLPVGATVPDGTVISNTASLSGENALEDTDTSDVTVVLAREVKPVVTKAWAPSGSFTGTNSQSTIILGVHNSSSPSLEVTSLSVDDVSADVFEYVDVTSISLDSFPAGANVAELFVDTGNGFVLVGSRDAVGEFTFPAGTDASDVVGVRVVYRNSDGLALPTDPTNGNVSISVQLRDTKRSDGTLISVTERQTIENCATPSAVEAELGTVTGEQACVNHFIYPPTAELQVAKAFFPDANGNFAQDAGEYAVVGRDSGVSASIDVTNSASFPLGTIVISEPSAAGTEFDDADLSTIRLRFPTGATTASVLVRYEDGTSNEVEYAPNSAQPISVEKTGTRVTSVVVTYTGIAADGTPLIEPGSVSGLDVHGTIPGDLLTNEDLAGGTSPGVDNCAAATGTSVLGNSTGSAAGRGCATLEVVEPFTEFNGTKTSNHPNVTAGQPVTYRLTASNNGTVPMITPVLSDPPLTPQGMPDPNYQNLFEFLALERARVISPTGDDAVTLELLHLDDETGEGTWIPYSDSLPDTIPAMAIRATVNGVIMPASSVVIELTFEKRPSAEDGVVLRNCFTLNAGNLDPVDPRCAPQIVIGPRQDSAALNKRIEPAELPEFVPGRPAQTATVTLQVTNTGNVNAKNLTVEDTSEGFFDAVDFTGVTAIKYPTGSDRATLEYFLTDGTWTPPVETRTTGAQTLPPGVDAATVVGVRAVFTGDPLGESGGAVMTSCDAGGACRGEVAFAVSPRESLRSDAEAAIPETLVNTVNGSYITLPVDGNAAEPQVIPPADADLEFVDGSQQLDVQKTPNTNMAPGVSQVFHLQVKNTGTGNIPNILVVDELPEGLSFDESFVGDTIEGVVQPFRIVDALVPAGTPPVPAPVLTIIRDGEQVRQLQWAFPSDWVLPPSSEFAIEIAASLSPGVRAGETVTNTMGATSDGNDSFSCADPARSETDGIGDGLYCTDTAEVVTQAGAGFETRKWVAGDAALGWYNNRTNEYVETGSDTCPVLQHGGDAYTMTPCVALTNPGDNYKYAIKVVNAGTEPARHMVIVDRLPVLNDNGVIQPNRGTEWDNAPTLVGPPAVVHDSASAEVRYAPSADLCLDDLDLNNAQVCAADTWLEPFESTSPAFEADIVFGDDNLLEPAQSFIIAFEMTAPVQITQVHDVAPTVAWNSIARSAETVRENGQPRYLSVLEPLKVGIGVAFGGFDVSKSIGSNAAGVDPEALTYGFSYACTLPWLDDPDAAPISGVTTITGAGETRVPGIPAGADCSVWESDTAGGISDHPESDPVEFVIPRNGSGQTVTASVVNTFPATPPTVVPPTPSTPGTPSAPSGSLSNTGSTMPVEQWGIAALLMLVGAGILAARWVSRRRFSEREETF
nr:DUF5979 domain-containing protein [Lysinibacter cavernae]